MTENILPHRPAESKTRQDNYTFDTTGWPIDPATGKQFTRRQIVADPSIPYPHGIDPQNPGAYWQRRTPAELEAEEKRIAKRRKARQRRCKTYKRTAPTGMTLQTRAIATATVELIERANGDGQMLVNLPAGYRLVA